MNADKFAGLPPVVKEITEKIVKEYQPEKIILFGSYAWGTPGPDSDLDFFVIKKTDVPSVKRLEQIDKLFPIRYTPMDFLVYTPEQVKRRVLGGDFFVRQIVNSGKVLYAS